MPFIDGEYFTQEYLDAEIVLPEGKVEFYSKGRYEVAFAQTVKIDLKDYAEWVLGVYGVYIEPSEELMRDYFLEEKADVIVNSHTGYYDEIRLDVSDLKVIKDDPDADSHDPLF